MAKQIIVKCSKGEVVVETVGFQGSACITASQAFEQALGAVRETEPTQAMYGGSEEVHTKQ